MTGGWAARQIDEQLAPPTTYEDWFGREEGFAAQPRVIAETIPVDARDRESLVCLGFTESEACTESGRCLQCDVRLNISRQKFWNEYDKR